MRISIKICQRNQLDIYFIWPIKKNIIILKKLQLILIHNDAISLLHIFAHNFCCQAPLIIQNALLIYQWDLNHCLIMKLSKSLWKIKSIQPIKKYKLYIIFILNHKNKASSLSYCCKKWISNVNLLI